MQAADKHFNSKEVRSRRTAGDERVARIYSDTDCLDGTFQLQQPGEVQV